MRRGIILFLVIVVVTGAGYGLLRSHLREEDTSLTGYLQGLMLNFYGGAEEQLIRVNLYNHTIALYERGNLVRISNVAGTGNPNNATATPRGTFRILSKEKRHVSGLSGVIMPLALRFHGGYYFHDIPLTPSGQLITTRYSHGCIRLPTALAQEVFAWANIGAFVEVYSSKLVRADDSPIVYLLSEDGHRQSIASEQAFLSRGLKWQDVVVVPSAEIAQMPIAGTLW